MSSLIDETVISDWNRVHFAGRRSDSTEIRQSPYGAAGSVLIVVCMDYAGPVSYFGADFTSVYTERFRSRSSKDQTLFD